MDWDALRRIVTEKGADGRSSVAIDGGPAKLLAVEEGGLAEIWAAALTASALHAGEDRLANEDVRLEPAKGAVKVRWFTVPAEVEFVDVFPIQVTFKTTTPDGKPVTFEFDGLTP